MVIGQVVMVAVASVLFNTAADLVGDLMNIAFAILCHFDCGSGMYGGWVGGSGFCNSSYYLSPADPGRPPPDGILLAVIR